MTLYLLLGFSGAALALLLTPLAIAAGYLLGVAVIALAVPLALNVQRRIAAEFEANLRSRAALVASQAADDVARLDELPVGGFRQFDYPGPGQPKLLVRIGDREVVAFDQRCTHLSCPVLPQVERGRFHCPCHNGNFDLATGRPLSGPPRRPLPRVDLELRDGVVWAVGVTERTS